MQNSNSHVSIHVGQRNIKTALAATICALLYFLVDQNPTFACIGAIFGVGSDMGNSRLNGGNRFFGTIIGGVLGMILFRIYICFYPDGSYHALMLLLLFIGVVVLIIVSQLFRWPGAIQPGGVVLCIILFNTPVDTYISYSVHRMIETGIGVAVALLINWLLSKERVDGWLAAMRRHPQQASAEEPALEQTEQSETDSLQEVLASEDISEAVIAAEENA